jgi:hypothetical protein
MTNPTLGTLTLPTPNGVGTEQNRKGAYTETLDGTVRRAIHADKRVYTLSYSMMTADNFNDLKTLYDKRNTELFVWSAIGANAYVHIDLGSRQFIPGNQAMYSGVEVTLTEV